MAQTTGAVAQACAKVEISTNGTVWTNISGHSQSVSGGEQTKMSGEAYTFDGDMAIVKGGKREPLELEFVIIYTETDADAYEVVRGYFEATGCGPNFYVRYSPRGGNADDEQLQGGPGVLSSFTYPSIDASAGGPILGGFKIKVPGLTTTIVAS